MTRHDFNERVAICMESGVPQRKAEEIAARQFFKSVNCPSPDDLERGRLIGWGKLKVFRSMNPEVIAEWKS